MIFFRNLFVAIPVAIFWIITLGIFEIQIKWGDGTKLYLPGAFNDYR